MKSALNIAHNKGINATPMEALIGCNAKHVAEPHILNSIQDEVHRLDLKTLRTTIFEHITEDQRLQKETYDKTLDVKKLSMKKGM